MAFREGSKDKSGTQRQTGSEILCRTERVGAPERVTRRFWVAAGPWGSGGRGGDLPRGEGARAMVLALLKALGLGSSAPISPAVAPAVSPLPAAWVVWFHFHQPGGRRSGLRQSRAVYEGHKNILSEPSGGAASNPLPGPPPLPGSLSPAPKFLPPSAWISCHLRFSLVLSLGSDGW